MIKQRRLRLLGAAVVPMIVALLPSLSSAGYNCPVYEPPNCKPRTSTCPPHVTCPPEQCPPPCQKYSLNTCFVICISHLLHCGR